MAASRLIAPVGIAATRTPGESAPLRRMAPLPQLFSIWGMGGFSALRRSSVSLGVSGVSAITVLDIGAWASLGWRPEYKPKVGLPPSRAERVRHMLQLVARQRDAVEPVHVRRLAESVHPHPRRLHQLPPLRARHRFQRSAESLPAPRLHLDERHETAAPHDEVDLAAPRPEAVRHDVPAAGEQVLDRLLLGREPALVALVGPGARIGA